MNGSMPSSDSTLRRTCRALYIVVCGALIISMPACANGGGAPRTYYFSDCQTGAAATCKPGSNSNSGTNPASPRQTLAGFNVNAQPAGTKLLFARGGSWEHSLLRLDNRRVSKENPLTFDAYGEGAAPLFRVARAKSYGFEFGEWKNDVPDGGYVFRNLKLDGLGVAEWGIWLRGRLQDVVIDSVEITGFGIAINSQANDPISHITVRNSKIVRNRDMGVLGTFNDSVFEGNLFAENNFRGSNMSHALYLGGGDRNQIKGNIFRDNSVVNGECRGGNVTMHGQMDTMLIEGNLISLPKGSDGCWGFSVTTGYQSAEWFRNFTVRNNTIVNVGGCSICADAVQNFVVEGNQIIQDHDRWHLGVMVRQTEQPDDAPNQNVVVRNNTACFKVAASHTRKVAGLPADAQSTGNAELSGAAASTGACVRRPAPKLNLSVDPKPDTKG